MLLDFLLFIDITISGYSKMQIKIKPTFNLSLLKVAIHPFTHSANI